MLTRKSAVLSQFRYLKDCASYYLNNTGCAKATSAVQWFMWLGWRQYLKSQNLQFDKVHFKALHYWAISNVQLDNLWSDLNSTTFDNNPELRFSRFLHFLADNLNTNSVNCWVKGVHLPLHYRQQRSTFCLLLCCSANCFKSMSDHKTSLTVQLSVYEDTAMVICFLFGLVALWEKCSCSQVHINHIVWFFKCGSATLLSQQHMSRFACPHENSSLHVLG